MVVHVLARDITNDFVKAQNYDGHCNRQLPNGLNDDQLKCLVIRRHAVEGHVVHWEVHHGVNDDERKQMSLEHLQHQLNPPERP